MLVVFHEIAPSENTLTGFLADKLKFDRKINQVNYAKLAVLILVIFVQDNRYYTYKESLVSIN